MSDRTLFWQTKLAARLHDPAEKALVLLRDPSGHEGGTVKQLRKYLKLDDIFAKQKKILKKSDWWASAADRPQWPKDSWSQVRWTKSPVLIHPLSNETIDLRQVGGLNDTTIESIKQRSFNHFKQLADCVEGDPKKTLLAFWRFGPELLAEEKDHQSLGALWGLLPADTRVPDHTIWDHLDLSSAFTGAFHADEQGEAALLSLSIGPVQPFIAAARSTSDLWAGSHLLSTLAWETMKPIVKNLGPDAILFPRLRGIPQVDLWLREQGLPDTLFEHCEWQKGTTDANPLFSAALPNRFVAVVPADRVEELAERCRERVRHWLQALGKDVVNRLLDAVGEEKHESLPCYRQMREQLEDFPEVHWSAVPFSLIRPRNEERQTDLEITHLSESMAPFFGTEPGKPCGFLKSPAWQVLQKAIQWEDGTEFFAPNPGVLYPAVYDLSERVLAAAKSVRAFEQLEQKGWRCSLTGETEWLTTDEKQLKTSYRRQKDTLWSNLAEKKPAWAKQGEHLGALPAIKRLWPTIFAEKIGKALDKRFGRFVVSTHTLALAHQIDQWLKHGGLTTDDFSKWVKDLRPDRVALPRKMMRQSDTQKAALDDARKLLGLLERAGELDDGEKAGQIKQAVRKTLKQGQDDKGDFSLETYYGLLLMDGDRMGRILSGDDAHAITYAQSFHPEVREPFEERMRNNPRLNDYGRQKRAVSPNRHLAISGALNDFSQSIVPHVVEKEYLGKVLYAGGDDVLAMLPVADLLNAAQRLRYAWSGQDPDHEGGVQKGLTLQNGFAGLNGRLMRMMGKNATASAGLVVAHHQAPLGRILRELRAAESTAKNEGRRDALCIKVIKRSGGALTLTLDWGKQLRVLLRLRGFLADPAVSRRAVYHTVLWLKDLPEPEGEAGMLGDLLSYQFKRQTEQEAAWKHHDVPTLTAELAKLAANQKNDPLVWLSNFLSVAEFLARQTRTGGEA
ncbi:type III-B CRISPR-associated protein Cas10/Cmr2 [Methylohalobius crimeensis]|uniref:type III-B CRISPR-associated protein Cas10/Cmr2 n=1 Tax=Methylohalobius crimeensis TaxID=244365 RepID=UPI0003B72CBC|nr:type III-B CRISPR-associated protein Cas10/Cmr2 [Methylohalobius crimeensis]